MTRKLFVFAAAAAAPVGMIAATGGVAAAVKPPAVDLSHASVTCTNVTGVLKFAPALTVAGGNPENTNVKLTLTGCTATGVTGVTVISGKGAGVLHSASNAAANLLGTHAVTGQINIKWSTSPKPTFKMSTVTVNFINGGTSGSYGYFSVNAGQASVANDFAGSDNGASSTMYAETTQTVSQLLTDATPPNKGIKVIDLGTDATHLVANSLHLG